MIERAAVLVVAVAVIVLLGAGLSGARAEDALFRLGFGKPHVAQAERLEAKAGRATPGERRVLLLGRVRQNAGDDAGAAELARGATRREPENAEAWLLLSRTAQGEEARRAAQRLRELVPPVPVP